MNSLPTIEFVEDEEGPPPLPIVRGGMAQEFEHNFVGRVDATKICFLGLKCVRCGLIKRHPVNTDKFAYIRCNDGCHETV